MSLPTRLTVHEFGGIVQIPVEAKGMDQMQNLSATDASLLRREAESDLDFSSSINSEPMRPNIVLAAMFLSYPVVVISIIGLLVAGRPLMQTLLIAYCIQIFMCCLVFVIGYLSIKTQTVPHKILKVDELTPSEVSEHWKSYPSPGKNSVSQRAAVTSPDLAQGHALATNLASLGWDVHLCTDRDAVFGCVSARPSDWGLVICDLFAQTDTQAVMYDLADFREDCPEMPLLVYSGDAVREDLTGECRSVLDAAINESVLDKPFVEGMRPAGFNLTAAE